MNDKGNLFTSKNSIKTIDRLRVVYMLTAILFFIITEAGRNIYRPYIYSNEINDFGIADSIGNLGGIIVQIFFTLAILNSPKNKVINVIVFIIAGYILYEIVQPYLPRGVFDWKDIYATFAGGLVAFVVWIIIRKFIKNKIIFIFK